MAAPEQFGIGKAVKELQNGQRVSRAGWNGPNQFLRLVEATTISDMDLPYIAIHTVQGQQVPWLCSQTDLLAVDWQVW